MKLRPTCIAAMMLSIVSMGSIPKNERDLVREADLIFEGTVSSVQYKLSEPVKGATGIPHTFVSFEVLNVFKGSTAPSRKVTLRFTGGYNASTNKILMVSEVPLFDVGERVVLFVAGNTMQLCPLVGWTEGHYRVVNDLIYSSDGLEVSVAGGSIQRGAYRAVDEVVINKVNEVVLSRRASEPGAEEGIKQRGPKVTPSTRKEFADYVTALVRANQKSLVPSSPFVSADIEKPFSIDLAPVAPPATEESTSKKR